MLLFLLLRFIFSLNLVLDCYYFSFVNFEWIECREESIEYTTLISLASLLWRVSALIVKALSPVVLLFGICASTTKRSKVQVYRDFISRLQQHIYVARLALRTLSKQIAVAKASPTSPCLRSREKSTLTSILVLCTLRDYVHVKRCIPSFFPTIAEMQSDSCMQL